MCKMLKNMLYRPMKCKETTTCNFKWNYDVGLVKMFRKLEN